MRRIDKAERQTYLKPARFGLFVAGPALIFVASKGKRIEAGRRDTTSISIRERHCQFRRLLSRADEPEKS